MESAKQGTYRERGRLALERSWGRARCAAKIDFSQKMMSRTILLNSYYLFLLYSPPPNVSARQTDHNYDETKGSNE